MKQSPLVRKTPLKPKRRSDPRWQATRLLVLERANHCCEFCGCPHVRLEAHHMIKVSQDPNMRYDLQNLVALCGFSECHDHNKEREMWHRFKLIRPDDCAYLLLKRPQCERFFREAA